MNAVLTKHGSAETRWFPHAALLGESDGVTLQSGRIGGFVHIHVRVRFAARVRAGPAVTGRHHIHLDLGLTHEDGRLARFASVSPCPKEKLLDLLSASD